MGKACLIKTKIAGDSMSQDDRFGVGWLVRDAAGQGGLEVGRFVLGREELHLDLEQARRAEPVAEVGLAEAEPVVAVEFAGLVEVVLVEIEDDESTALAEELRSGGDGLLGIGDMVERLAEDDEIDAAGRDGWIGEIAEAVLEVGDVFLLRFGATEGDHPGGVIDGDDFLRPAREQLREPALARAEVRDDDTRYELREEGADFGPGATGAEAFAEAPGDAVEVVARGGAAFFEHEPESGGIGGGAGDFLQGEQGGVEDLARFLGELFDERVVGALALAAGLDESDAAQMGEVRGDAGLAEVEDFLQLRDGEFLLLQQREDAEPGGIVEGLPEGAEGHGRTSRYIYLSGCVNGFCRKNRTKFSKFTEFRKGFVGRPGLQGLGGRTGMAQWKENTGDAPERRRR